MVYALEEVYDDRHIINADFSLVSVHKTIEGAVKKALDIQEERKKNGSFNLYNYINAPKGMVEETGYSVFGTEKLFEDENIRNQGFLIKEMELGE